MTGPDLDAIEADLEAEQRWQDSPFTSITLPTDSMAIDRLKAAVPVLVGEVRRLRAELATAKDCITAILDMCEQDDGSSDTDKVRALLNPDDPCCSAGGHGVRQPARDDGDL